MAEEASVRLFLLAAALVTASAFVEACGDDDGPSGAPSSAEPDASSPSDGSGPTTTNDGASTGDGPTPDSGSLTVACPLDAGAGDASYLVFEIDGVVQPIKRVTIEEDPPGRIFLYGLTPTNERFDVKLDKGTVGTFASCPKLGAKPFVELGWTYLFDASAFTAATSFDSMSVPCSVTLSTRDNGTVTEGVGAGKLHNSTTGIERTIDFRVCWSEPLP
jgi:hypothetical protein